MYCLGRKSVRTETRANVKGSRTEYPGMKFSEVTGKGLHLLSDSERFNSISRIRTGIFRSEAQQVPDYLKMLNFSSDASRIRTRVLWFGAKYINLYTITSLQFRMDLNHSLKRQRFTRWAHLLHRTTYRPTRI